MSDPNHPFGTGFNPAQGLAAGIAFLTRVPRVAEMLGRPTANDLAAGAWSFPIVGAAIGLVGGIAMIISTSIGLSVVAGGIIVVLVTAALTGALHEDGLADTVDGFGGGTTPEEKLEIMRDSRLGTYGGLALIFSVMLRAAALAGLAVLGNPLMLLVLMSAEAASRAAMVRLWNALPPARMDGLAYSAGRPDDRTTLTALAAGTVIAFILTLILAGFWSAIVALAGTAAVVLLFESICRSQIGGQTGDTLGAGQQIAAATYLLLALAFT